MANHRPPERTPVREPQLPRTRELLPSEVRARVLAQHQFLRGELNTIRELAKRIDGKRDAMGVAELKARISEFLGRLEQHMSYEEQVLKPVLLEVDPARPALVECMHEDHLEQRREFRRFIAELGNLHAERLGERVRELARHLLLDMDNEDRVLLNPDVLRDDAISIAQEDG